MEKFVFELFILNKNFNKYEKIDYNKAIGYINIYTNGSRTIKGRLYLRNYKRFPKNNYSKKEFVNIAKSFEFSIPRKFLNNEINSLFLDKIKEYNKARFPEYYINSSFFHTIGSFIDWNKYLNSL